MDRRLIVGILLLALAWQGPALAYAYVRTLMIHGARSALQTAAGKEDRLSRWVVALAKRSHPNVAATALANKMARVAWAMLRHGTNYEPGRLAA